MQRLLGLDFGEKRIGVAVSDPLGFTAQPLDYIPNSKKAIRAISALINDYSVSDIVLGLPKLMSGAEGKSAAAVRRFGDKLAARFDVTVVYVDERLSTVAAEKALLSGDVSRKRRREVIDSLAAQYFLTAELQKRQKLPLNRNRVL